MPAGPVTRRRIAFEAVRGDLGECRFVCGLLAGNPNTPHHAVLCRAAPTERLYVLSLGRQEVNQHVCWHLAPLPPGVPFEEQQLAALDIDLGLDLSEEELAMLAARIRGALDETGMGPPAA